MKKTFDLVINSPPPLHPAAQVTLVVGVLVIVGITLIMTLKRLLK